MKLFVFKFEISNPCFELEHAFLDPDVVCEDLGIENVPWPAHVPSGLDGGPKAEFRDILDVCRRWSDQSYLVNIACPRLWGRAGFSRNGGYGWT